MSAEVKALSKKIQALSAEQLCDLEDYVDHLRVDGENRSLSHNAARFSEPVFATIWNNEEDDVYDAL